MAKVSIRDIAKKAEVSNSLVSFVLNGRGDELNISKETQLRVKKTAEQMNYRPNQVARSLRLRKTNTIGLILPNITDEYFSTIANSVEKKADKNHYQTIICNTHEDEKKELKQIQMLIDRGVDGLIIAPSKKEKSWIEELRENDVPFVLIDRKFSDIDTNYVIYENFKGSFEIIDHLIQLGVRKIAQLTLFSYIDVIAERDRGYREALKKNGIRYNKKMIREISVDNMYDDVKISLKRLLKPPISVEAVYTHNNVLAEKVLQCADEMKLRIPKDFSLVSFGCQNMFKFTNPPITCIQTPDEEIGVQAMRILLQSMNKKKNRKTEKVILPVKMVLRESCGRFFL